MPTKRTSSQTQRSILEAGGRILRASGARKLTLSAVAQEAGISKGGLLYHFPSKQALIEGLFRFQADSFDAQVERLYAVDSAEKGSWLRAFAQASIDQIEDDDNATLLAGLYAAADEYPSVHDIMRERYDIWQARIEKSRVDPILATLFRLVIDGLWFSEMYAYAPPSAERREQILDVLDVLITTYETQSSS